MITWLLSLVSKVYFYKHYLPIVCPFLENFHIYNVFTRVLLFYGLFIGQYCHPNQNVENFKDSFDEVLVKITRQGLPCIIAGDINIDLTKCTVVV